MEKLYSEVKRLQTETKDTQELKDQLAESQRQLAEFRDIAEKLLARELSTTAGGQSERAEILVQGGHAQVDNRKIHNELKVRNEVTVNVFGQEKVDHITAPQIYQLLMNAKGAADPGIQALLDTALVVFSDPAKPENLTCYLPNKKTSDALVHEAEGWQIKPIETVLSPMVRRSLDVLFRKQPYGHEPGLPDRPDIVSCGEVLKQVAALEADPTLAKKTTAPHGPLRTVLVRNKDALARVNGGVPPTAGGQKQKP